MIQGCVDVTLGKPIVGDYSIEHQQMGQYTLYTTIGNADFELPTLDGEFELEPNNGMDVTLSLICGTNLGMSVLCGSDGALITLDGKYLIVVRQ